MHSLTNWIAHNGIDWGIKVGIAIAIFFVGKVTSRKLSNLLKKIHLQSGTDSMLVEFLGRIDLVIGISYDDNIGQARDIIMALFRVEQPYYERPHTQRFSLRAKS